MRSIQSILAGARLENEFNGLPCGEYVYKDPMKIENRYQDETGAIIEKFGSKANWRAWDPYIFTEINTGKRISQFEIAAMTGTTLKEPPELALPLIDQSRILIEKRW